MGKDSAVALDLNVAIALLDAHILSASLEVHAMGILDRRTVHAERPELGLGVTPILSVPVAHTDASSGAYLEVGIGAVGYSAPYPAGGSRLHFTRQFGLAVRRRLGRRTAFGAVRWFHSSNQDLYGRARNPGFDALGVFLGIERGR